ncbi:MULTISPECIES: BrnA antitoxin family protein [Methylobacterium]|uniref:BrnA antitoxin family protein n=1 Tax=Methylobacterium TaxID=407 RepID=UPI0013EC8B33|nr:BrnA antitoxin family protein [Methylobacterium sp. DB0501]NGM36410.1 BrnA antitoxin family protein [Methylobacterium sp. DB0501]
MRRTPGTRAAFPPRRVFQALPRRGGRPETEKRKLSVTPRPDPKVVKAFKTTGPGWQTRINAMLASAIRPLAQNLDEADGAERQESGTVHRREKAAGRAKIALSR